MKTLTYSLVLFFLSSCFTAQNNNTLHASHETVIGGVKGSRAEKFTLRIPYDQSLEVMHLLVGEVQIKLNQTIEGDEIYLTGQYFPDTPPQHPIMHKDNNSHAPKFDLNNVFLVFLKKDGRTKVQKKVQIIENESADILKSMQKVPE